MTPPPASPPPGARAPGAGRQGARGALVALLVSRGLVWAAGIAGVLVLGVAHPPVPKIALDAPWDVLTAPGTRWDAAHYVGIAGHGYPDARETAFFPLYPLLVRAVAVLVRSEVAAGLLVSLAAFAGALLVLRRLAALELGPRAAERAVWLLALFPAAIFYSAIYTESLFLLLCLGTFLCARLGAWGRAAALAALAAATRSSGVLLVLPLALLYLYGPREDAARRPDARRLRPRYPVDRRALWVLLVPAGLGAYLAYGWARFGDPLTAGRAQDLWGRSFQGPLSALWLGAKDGAHAVGTVLGGSGGSGSALRQLALCGVVALAITGTVGALRRLPAAYGAWAVASLAVALSAPLPNAPLNSTPRYIAVVFPIFLWLATVVSRPWAYRAVLALFVLGLLYASAWFSSWRFLS